MELPTLHVVASVLAWMSATINPFIYAFKNRQYQQAFKKVKKYFARSLVLQKICGDVGIFQLVCYTKSGSARSGPRTTTSQASGQSRASQSRTLVTEMVHYRDRGGEQASCSVAQPRQP